MRDRATLCKEIDYLAAQVDTLRKERDAARREVCRSRASCIKNKHPEKIANALEWDCFKGPIQWAREVDSAEDES